MRIPEILTACIFCVCLGYSQTEQELWNSLQAKMATGVKGNFQVTKYVAKLSKTFFSEGEFEVSAKNGITWQTQKPVKNTVNMSMDSLKTFFSGDYQTLKNRFDLELSGSKGYNTLKLFPKEKSVKRVVESVELRIAGNELKGCLITWGNKDRAMYEFSVP